MKSVLYYNVIVFFTLALSFLNKGFAQDTTKVKKNERTYIAPKKAAALSAALPGLGQIYNRKYWKLPIVYGAFAGLGYALYTTNNKYANYRDAYKARIDNDPETIDEYEKIYSADNLKSLHEYYHRYRDLSVVGLVVVYVLNIVDASVDAHLARFDVSDNLSMRIQPTTIYTSYNQLPAPGFRLTANFK
ncbi:MAG: hypothetical protein J0M08_04940 [Bacteroidetes bacterium]|nr:hypothetical protein [Bacteroidota bacterium]